MKILGLPSKSNYLFELAPLNEIIGPPLNLGGERGVYCVNIFREQSQPLILPNFIELGPLVIYLKQLIEADSTSPQWYLKQVTVLNGVD